MTDLLDTAKALAAIADQARPDIAERINAVIDDIEVELGKENA